MSETTWDRKTTERVIRQSLRWYLDGILSREGFLAVCSNASQAYADEKAFAEAIREPESPFDGSERE